MLAEVVRGQTYWDLEAELGARTFIDPLACSHNDGEPCGAMAIDAPFPWSSLLIAVVGLTHDPAESREALLVGLHELGHIARHHVGRRGLRIGPHVPALRREAEAWEWALEHVPFELDSDDWAAIAWRLRTYADVDRLKPQPSFDRLLARAERGSHERHDSRTEAA